MRSLLLLTIVASGCAPSLFIRRTTPPLVMVPPEVRTVAVERASSGSAVLDLIKTFSFSDPRVNLDRAAVDAVVAALAREGVLRAVADCARPCPQAEAVLEVSVTNLSITPSSQATLVLNLDLTRADGTSLSRREWPGEARAATSDPASDDGLVLQALDSAASAFAAGMRPHELSEGFRLSTGAALEPGNKLLLAGDAPGAIAKYRQLLALEPDNAEVHHNLAVAYTADGQLEAALQSAKEAGRCSPTVHAYTVYQYQARLDASRGGR